jgi:hypothetical protein
MPSSSSKARGAQNKPEKDYRMLISAVCVSTSNGPKILADLTRIVMREWAIVEGVEEEVTLESEVGEEMIVI